MTAPVTIADDAPADLTPEPTGRRGRGGRGGARGQRSHLGPGGVSTRAGWYFLMPNLLGYIGFTAVPVLFAIGIAFTSWNVVSGLGGIKPVGLENFTDLLSSQQFWSAVGRTLYYGGVSVPLTLILGLLLALALNSDVVGRGPLRLVFFMPTIANQIAVGFVWLLMLHPTSGLVNVALQALGWSEPPAWLTSQSTVIPALIIIHVWGGVGFQALILVAALQSVPSELYEAAQLDGANAWRRFWTITVPALMPTITFLLINALIGQSQGFGLIAFLTQGGPGAASTTLPYLMYQNGFQFYRFGYAAAIGLLSFVGVAVLAGSFWRFQRDKGMAS
ncbi:carbohydrate ABC transporter permease [Aestuariimicrobium soli]|uniref:carbohydrate ABC transporter permease n=1 Tax=Aestuariimicrobium soli TaxID=2035834 RepID=UPI003EBF68EA